MENENKVKESVARKSILRSQFRQKQLEQN